ncbi:MAG: hypothetical protein ACTHU0_20150 [Kofleriaceae bacterium]
MRLEAALAPLVGLPLWKSHRAANLQSFQFGAKRTVTSELGARKGQPAEVGDYALHVQCAWRIRGPHGLVVGSRDRYYRPGPAPLSDEDDGWHWDAPGANRCDERIGAWIQARSYRVERVSADATGGIVLVLAGGFALEVFPDDSLCGESCEHWRLLRPNEESDHFVVGNNGIDT